VKVDEQTLNKGAMREKRVQQALQVAQRSLEELDGAVGILLPTSVGLPTPAAATPPPTQLMPIAPAPASQQAMPVPAPTRSSPSQSPSPVPQHVSHQHNVQQNGSNKRPLRTPAMPIAAVVQEAKRPRVDKPAVAVDSSLSFEERKLRIEERRLAVAEERLAWEKQKSQQEAKERQALLDVLRAQGSLVTELLAHLRSAKMAMNPHGL